MNDFSSKYEILGEPNKVPKKDHCFLLEKLVSQS